MSTHSATIRWERAGDAFADGRYHRAHRWHFDGGVEVCASASPSVVPLPLSVEEAVDPEEAFVAALSSCHMLWFLAVAQRRGYVVDRYEDDAWGLIARNGEGQLAMTEVRLAPCVSFAGERPDDEQFRAMHDEAHHRCFLAASVRADILCDPRIAEGGCPHDRDAGAAGED